MARLPRPRTRRLCALLALVLALVVAPTAAGQADPSVYLPGARELPPGLVHQPDLDRTLSDEGVVSLQRHYVRRAPDSTVGHETRLIVAAEVADSPARAADRLRADTRDIPGQGWSFESLDGVIGDESAVGRKDLDREGPRPSEWVQVKFRIGATLGVAVWGDYADLPNIEEALAVARVIEARMAARAGPASDRADPR